jgi:hypothetical protein
MMHSFHARGAGPLCGAQLRYLIHSSTYGYLGALAFSSAAWALKDRDQYIGWSEAARRHNLQRVIQNSRFLIVPTVQVPNLASRVLSLSLARVAQDWKSCYGVEPIVVETFVDPEHHSGTCYRAANWRHVGKTSGRRARHRGEGPKDIYVYPLVDRWREILCEEPPYIWATTPRPEAPADWVEAELGTVELYDGRLRRRLLDMVRDFYRKPLASIPEAFGGSQAKSKAAYRFFANPKVSMESILRAHVESTLERIKQHSVVLAVQDTTILDYTAHPATEGLGPTHTRQSPAMGLILHDTLAFTPEGIPLGLLDVQCWARDPKDRGKKYRRAELPIEEKESFKWIRSYRTVRELHTHCPQTTFVSVGDRESDIYELFLEKHHDPTGPELLIRCEKSRNRSTEEGRLWEVMAQQPVCGQLAVHVPRKGCRPAREALLEVRYASLELQPPKGSGYPPLALWVVHAREVEAPAHVPEPLEWMLATSMKVSSLEEACERIDWYAKRWGIEVYHRTLKSGCRIEDRHLGTADRLEACLALDMVVAWRIFYLTLLGRQVPDLPCGLFFEEAEWKALYMVVHQTQELPSQEPTLEEAILLLGRLGGYLARKGDKGPGTTTLWRGLVSLASAVALYRVIYPSNTRGP